MLPRTDVTLTVDKRRRARVHPSWMEAHAYPASVAPDTRRVRKRLRKRGSADSGGVSPQRALSLVPRRRFLSENAAAIESRARAVCSPRALSSRLPPRDTRDSQQNLRLE